MSTHIQGGRRGAFSPPAGRERNLGEPKKTWSLKKYHFYISREAAGFVPPDGEILPLSPPERRWPPYGYARRLRKTANGK